MNLNQIIKKVVGGVMPDAGEIEFLKTGSFEERHFLEEIDRLEAANVELTRHVESNGKNHPEYSQGKIAEPELTSLRQLAKQLSDERDTAQKELKHWKFRQQIGELAGQYQFSDVEYLTYLCEKNQIDLAQPEAAGQFMSDLRSQAPKFFRADIQSGAKTDLSSSANAAPGVSIAELLTAAPEITH